VWSESHSTRASAMQREREIKRMKSARWIREHLLNR
jgi:predicted GIY-YIG superfamily endonuclease